MGDLRRAPEARNDILWGDPEGAGGGKGKREVAALMQPEERRVEFVAPALPRYIRDDPLRLLAQRVDNERGGVIGADGNDAVAVPFDEVSRPGEFHDIGGDDHRAAIV